MVGIIIMMRTSVAQAGMAEFIEAAIGCPSEDGLIAVYTAAEENNPPDFNTVQAVVEHYNCEWIMPVAGKSCSD